MKKFKPGVEFYWGFGFVLALSDDWRDIVLMLPFVSFQWELPDSRSHG